MTSATHTLDAIESVVDIVNSKNTNSDGSGNSGNSGGHNAVAIAGSSDDNISTSEYRMYSKLINLGLDKWNILDLMIGRLDTHTIRHFKSVFGGVCGVAMTPTTAGVVNKASVMHRRGKCN